MIGNSTTVARLRNTAASMIALASASALHGQAPVPAANEQRTGAASGSTGQTEVSPRVSTAVPPMPVAGPGAPAPARGVQEIIVTAQKREENLSKVPMSITALSSQQMAQRQIQSPKDLAKLVPSFQYSQSITGTPVFTIRGVGFNDTAAGARPAVSVYIDQAPIPFSVETLGTGLDLERVEVLKGPQGTLFGQNATGGAINYIAAKPTRTLQAGGSLSYGNYAYVDAQAFVSGPISDTLRIRVAAQHTGRGNWQRSTTRDDGLGQKDITAGRLLVDWTPSDRFKLALNLNGFLDNSDTQAGQFIDFVPITPAFADRIPAQYRNPVPAGRNDRDADWTPGIDYRHHDKFGQATARAEYTLNDIVQLTSLTSFSDFKGRYFQDPDGSAYRYFQYGPNSHLQTISEELRAAADFRNGLRLIAGINYEHDKIDEQLDEQLSSTASFAFSALPGGPPQFTAVVPTVRSKTNTIAGFANADYDISTKLTLHGAVRYTSDKTDFAGCNIASADGAAARGFTIVQSRIRAAAGAPPYTILPGTCITLNTQNLQSEVIQKSLDEHSVSWRAGLDFKPTSTTLLYANASKGYKIGSFPVIGANFDTQLEPARQESVMAYEAGFKTKFLDNTLRLEGAGFHYDYKNKQVLGSFTDPTFGALHREVNIPKSDLWGGEIQLTWAPSSAFTLSGGGTYLKSRIKGHFVTQNVNDKAVDIGGEAFPFAPKWQGVLDAEYRFEVGGDRKVFLGASGSAQTHAYSEIGEIPETYNKGYATLDLRAGLRGSEDRWSLTLWAQNVTNTYYWSDATKYHDTFVRFTGMPRTFGMTVAIKSR